VGATLTLPSRDGNYIIAATTFFLTIVESSLWQILCRIAFRLGSKNPKDALSHQQRAILKNSISSSSALVKLGLLTSAWRSKIGNAASRSGIFIAMALVNLALFTTASIFSSRIAAIHSNVLLDPYSHCGSWNYTQRTGGSYGALDGSTSSTLLLQNLAASQAIVSCARSARNPQQCSPIGNVSPPYSSWCTTLDSDCLKPSDEILAEVVNLDNLNYIQHDEYNRTAELWSDYCPFDNNMCMNGTFTLDSGLIDTYVHLGINSLDSIQFRDILTCAPLNTGDNYSTIATGNTTFAGVEVNIQQWLYWYGRTSPIKTNLTYEHYVPVNPEWSLLCNDCSGPPFNVE